MQTMQVPLRAARLLTRRVVRPLLGPRVPIRRQRQIVDALLRFPILPKGTRVEGAMLGGIPTDKIATAASNPDRAMLYLHGGAYVLGSPRSHRAAAAHLAHSAGVVAHVLDYRLAPEAPYPAAVDDALAAYQALLGTGLQAHQIVVAGDSAGGGLSLALALRIRSLGLPMPAALGLISPWVDPRNTGLAERIDDPLLTRAWMEQGAQAYAGSDRDRPEVSPLLADPADLAALPPLFVHGASDEVLIDDVERFVAAAEAAGASVTFRTLEGHWHVTHLYAGTVREATEVVQEMGGWLRAALDQRA